MHVRGREILGEESSHEGETLIRETKKMPFFSLFLLFKSVNSDVYICVLR
jgi:hypothetical protein